MRWGSNDIVELRQRLTSNTVLLTAFMSTFPVVVERKLNTFVQEFRDGKREGSVISVASVESLTLDDKHMWREIRKELEDIGISIAAFDANKSFILQWFQNAIENGSFEEEPVENGLDSDSMRISCSSSASSEYFVDGEDTMQEQNMQTSTALHHGEMPTSSFHQSRNKQILISTEHVRDYGAATISTSDPATVKIRNKRYEKSEVATKSQLVDSQSASTPFSGLSNAPRKITKLKMFLARIRNLNSAFFEACEKGDIEVATRLLEKGADINARSSDRRSVHVPALVRVCTIGTIATETFLLDNGADSSLGSSIGHETPLIAAIERRSPQLVRLLCKCGADIRLIYRLVFNVYVQRLISDPAYNVKNYCDQTIRRLDSCRLTPMGDTVLKALKSPDPVSQKVTRIVIQKAGGDKVSYPSELLYALVSVPRSCPPRDPLQFAADKRNLDVIHLLLLTGTDVNEAHGPSSSTTLIEAAKLPSVVEEGYTGKERPSGLIPNEWKFKILRLLLEKGPYLEIKDKDGYTALDHAMSNSTFQAARSLFAAGAVNNFHRLASSGRWDKNLTTGEATLSESICKGYLRYDDESRAVRDLSRRQ